MKSESMSPPPLRGIRVVDFTHVLSLPYTSALMSDMGAEVIKVEGPDHPDPTRTSMGGCYPGNQPGGDWWNRSSIYNILNRGKQSITLDLNTLKGKELFKNLVSISDVVLENYAPRVMNQMGLNYANLCQVRPDIIMLSNSGYGHGHGPYSEYPGQASTLEATQGLCAVTGYREGPPSKAGVSNVDFIATWSALFAIGASLSYRLRTGHGQWIDLAMYQAGVMSISDHLMDSMANGHLAERIGNRHFHRAPQGCYRTKGQDSWIVVSIGSDQQWEALCRLMDNPQLATDPRFMFLLSRMKNHDELDEIISMWTNGLYAHELTEKLQSEGIAAGPVLDGKDMHQNPQFKAREFLEMVEYPHDRNIGNRPMIGRPYRFSENQVTIRGAAPPFGKDNHRVLVDLLGVTEDEYESLMNDGTIAMAPRTGEPTPTSWVRHLTK
jgi:crotonobetainyl-CoA:carnitine CoA-transferase CaiB-like acyl-CoA transferase